MNPAAVMSWLIGTNEDAQSQPRSAFIRSIGRVVYRFEAIALVLLACAFGMWFQPQPVSDWLYYWQAAQDLSLYQRGGAGLLALAGLAASGMTPWVCAVLINLIAACALLWLVRDSSGHSLQPHTVALYMLLITPFFAVVQLDLLAATALAWGIWLLASVSSISRRKLVIGMLLVVAAVSTRPQLFLLLLAWIGLLWLLPGCRRAVNTPLVVALLCAMGLGFAADLAARSVAGHGHAVRTSSAVTLYAGLLMAEPNGHCGHWTERARDAAHEDIDRPLMQAVWQRVTDRGWQHWRAVFACKLPQIVLPKPFALDWAAGSGTSSVVALAPDLPLRWRQIEAWTYLALTLTIYLVTLLPRTRAALTSRHWRWPFAWLLAFMVVHGVFEIQGRYFLPLLLLLPVWQLLGLRLDHHAIHHSFASSRKPAPAEVHASSLPAQGV